MSEGEADIRFNVLNHEHVPFTELLPDEELPELLAMYNIQKEQLPKVKSNDPTVQVVKAKPGQVVRIRRASRTAGVTTVYRLVIEAL